MACRVTGRQGFRVQDYVVGHQGLETTVWDCKALRISIAGLFWFHELEFIGVWVAGNVAKVLWVQGSKALALEFGGRSYWAFSFYHPEAQTSNP